MIRENVREHAGKWVLAVAALALLWACRPVLLSLAGKIILGGLLAWLLYPLCRALEKRLSRGAAAVVSVLLFAALFVLLFALLLPPLAAQVSALAGVLPQALRDGYAWLEGKLSRLPVDTQELARSVSGAIQTLGTGAVSMMARSAGGIASFVSNVLFAFVLGVYFLKDRELFLLYASMLIPLRWRKKCLYACMQVRRELSGYVRGQLTVSAGVAALTALGLFFIRVPYYLVLGILMGLMDVIPYFGPVIGAIPIVIFSLQRGVNGMIWALAVVILVQQAEANLLCPRVMGRSTGLHPVTVMMGLLCGGMLAGVWGMLAAVPAILCARAVFRVIRADP